MNPAKRKKLLNLEIAQKKQEDTQSKIVEEKKELETPKQTFEQKVEQATILEASTLEMGLKLPEENKKEKKKKWSSQDS